MALYTCSKCGKRVPMQYEICPFCQTPRPKPEKAEKAAEEKKKKKHPILAAVTIILVVFAIGSVIGGGDKSGASSSEQDDLVYDVDWNKCSADLKESVLNQDSFPYAKDIYVIVDEDKKEITFSAVVGDSTDPSVALDYADTIVRQYNLMASMQDNNIALGSKDYYGGLYDKYDFLIGVAPQSKTDDSDQWFVFDASIAGAHQALELQKAYR